VQTARHVVQRGVLLVQFAGIPHTSTVIFEHTGTGLIRGLIGTP
jgi:hypothetical protein